ncbi:MAG: crossover junction endodeoxyribonuclease RuvC, partial [Erythrobacteraceae bacterium]
VDVCLCEFVHVYDDVERLDFEPVKAMGAAEKAQVVTMVKVLLPGVALAGSDAADALAVAIADAHLGPRS